MASPSSASVFVGKPQVGGAIFSAPTGTDVPTSASATLTAAFANLGYVSEDGLVNSIETNYESITAWGGDEVLKALTSRSEAFTWSFLQTDADVLKEVYGQSNVTVESDTLAVIHNAATMPKRVFVFDILLTEGKVMRHVIPSRQITEVGDVNYKDGEPISYEVTLSCFPDSAGNTAYTYVAGVKDSGD